MTDSIKQILQILVAGGILSTILTVVFHQLSLRRQYRQALDQKMIDRISHLVEHYYGQISNASENLRSALNQTLLVIHRKQKAERYLHISFCRLAAYLHQTCRLARERPQPLFTEICAERDYVRHINTIYGCSPFDDCDVSYLLSCYQRENGITPAHELVASIDKDKTLQAVYNKFSWWMGKCECQESVKEDCEIHKVIEACYYISDILEDQTQKMYKLWYDRKRKRPRIHGSQSD
jgi:hypothetical protein